MFPFISFKFGRSFVRLVLIASLAFSPSFGYAQSTFVAALPEPGVRVGLSSAFMPVLVRGLVVHPDKPLDFDFIVDSGSDSSDEAFIKEQSQLMAKYFLAAITVPSEQLWVNLSPYEHDRVIENELGRTVLGRDMLAQDYILKQLTASLIYPEEGLGKEFWAKVYAQAQAKFGTTNIPVDTFNKVWIMPAQAEVFEKGNAVYVTGARLKIMLDSDRTAMMENVSDAASDEKVAVAKAVVREIILPAIEKEVNEGRNFAAIRQIYYASILAKWYRDMIQDTLLSEAYVDKNKVAGVTSDNKELKEEIYQRYIAAYKKGVFNYIKEENDGVTGNAVSRRYFSGGIKIDFSQGLSRSDDRAAINSFGKDRRTYIVAFKIMPEERGLNALPDVAVGNQPLVGTAALNGGVGIQNIDIAHPKNHVKIKFNNEIFRDALKEKFNGFAPIIVKATLITSLLVLPGVNEGAGAGAHP